MATLSLEIAAFNDREVVVELDILTSNWRVSQIRCINNSQHDAVGYIYNGEELVFTAVGTAGQTTTWNTTGVQLGWQEDYWNDITETWEPSGIEMFEYRIQIQWPGEVQ